MENHRFGGVLDGRTDAVPRSEEDPDADRWIEDGEKIADLLADYAAQCAVGREIVTGPDLDHEVGFRGDRTPSVRRVLLHVVEETARHAGRLDVVRELLDGATGEWWSHAVLIVRRHAAWQLDQPEDGAYRPPPTDGVDITLNLWLRVSIRVGPSAGSSLPDPEAHPAPQHEPRSGRRIR